MWYKCPRSILDCVKLLECKKHNELSYTFCYPLSGLRLLSLKDQCCLWPKCNDPEQHVWTITKSTCTSDGPPQIDTLITRIIESRWKKFCLTYIEQKASDPWKRSVTLRDRLAPNLVKSTNIFKSDAWCTYTTGPVSSR